MKSVLSRAVILSVALFGGVASASAQNSGRCLSSHDIQGAIAGGEILPLSAVLQRAGIDKGVKILEPVEVCERAGRLYYQINLLDRSGNATKALLNAVTGGS